MFPRFYFLSDDDLLQILAKTKGTQAVQPHLRQCFEGISKLTLVSEGDTCTLLAITSAENKTVPFDKTASAQGDVESRLCWIQLSGRSHHRCSDAMSKFLKGLAMNATSSCSDEFNRIDIEVPSPLEIFSIQEPVRADESEFVFQDAEISVHPSSAVFLAMNPGYQTP